MYAGRVACWLPLVSYVEYALRAVFKLEKYGTNRRSDARSMHYARRGQRTKTAIITGPYSPIRACDDLRFQGRQQKAVITFCQTRGYLPSFRVSTPLAGTDFVLLGE